MNAATPPAERLTAAERDLLREVARQAVAAAARDEAEPDPRELAAVRATPLSARLLAPCGAFVSLHLDGNLRGCIGYLKGQQPLIDAVARNGRNAAVNDPRFPPLSSPELAHVELEVSVLTPLRQVTEPDEIEIGRHGILLEKDNRQAVFLPQVPLEQGWDLATTLTHLCLKAGLAGDAWRDGARFEVFEAEVF